MPTLIMSDAEFETLKKIRPTLIDARAALQMASRKRLDISTRQAIQGALGKIDLLLDAKGESDRGND